MPEKNNGGPAFGQVVELRCVRVDMTGSTEWEPEAMVNGGLTVRDYFAAKAMQAFCTRNDDFTQLPQVAEEAYVMADAMMQAREAA